MKESGTQLKVENENPWAGGEEKEKIPAFPRVTAREKREAQPAFPGRRILLLQGPVGPFFRWLMKDLEAAGAQVFKVDFNGGDWLFSPRGAIAFRGRPGDWPGFLDRLLRELRIDSVLLCGDCRSIHSAACAVCNDRGVPVGVFEEGYLRPDFITFESCGVNGFSHMPRSPLFYRNVTLDEDTPVLPVGKVFRHMVLWNFLYYAAGTILGPLFPHYRHHRPLTAGEAVPWMKDIWRKRYYMVKERKAASLLSEKLAGRYFLVPLQVHYDAQIHIHSDFGSIEEFIEYVTASFARSAPEDAHLVFKHHPMDRGYKDYTVLIRELSRQPGLSGRVIYIHDQHLPTLLEQARGVVLVNSTTGFQAMHHGAAVKVLGKAFYDIEGLTFQGGLDDFWRAAPSFTPDHELYLKLRYYLIKHTQINGSFHKRLKTPEGRNHDLADQLEAKGIFIHGPGPAAAAKTKTKTKTITKIKNTGRAAAVNNRPLEAIND